MNAIAPAVDTSRMLHEALLIGTLTAASLGFYSGWNKWPIPAGIILAAVAGLIAVTLVVITF